MSEDFNKRAFYLSGAVHLTFFLLMGLVIVVKLFNKPNQEAAFVFEMIDAPSFAAQIPAIAQPLEPAILTPKVPEFEVRVRHVIELPQAPVTPVAAPPKPLPTAPRVPPVTKPQSKPKIEPQPTVKPMTLDQFRQQHGKPKPRPAPRPTVQRNVTVPTVAVPKFDSSPPRSSAPPRSSTPSPAVDAAYKAKLKHNANLAWDRPMIANTRVLEAKILYTIAPNGTIESVRFEQRSGNAVLDNSAIAAARKTKSPGPTPSGKREIIRIRFVIE